jgi:hypothetical protein
MGRKELEMSEENTGVIDPAAEEVVTEPVMIPKERLDAEIQKTQFANQKADLATQQADMLRQQEAIRAANVPQVDIRKELNLTDNDVATVAQQKIIDKHNLAEVTGRMNQLEAQLGQASFALQHQDAQEVLNEDFKQLIESDPTISALVNQLPADKQVQVAYTLGQMQKKITSAASAKNKKAKADVDLAIDNATRPLSASAVGGSTSGLSGSTKYQNMTGAEIAEMSRRAAQG